MSGSASGLGLVNPHLELGAPAAAQGGVGRARGRRGARGVRVGGVRLYLLLLLLLGLGLGIG